MTANKRLMNEFKTLQQNPLVRGNAMPYGDDLFKMEINHFR
jgi:hypothetical protein